MRDLSELQREIEAASARIGRHIVRTPLLENTTLNDALGFRLFLKPENIQNTGSFKVRGALNFLLARDAGPSSCFVGYSSGNHAQGLAYASKVCGSSATVLMPANAPSTKVEGARALGADVELLSDFFGKRQQRLDELTSGGAVFVPPFDHRDIVAGQGTVGLEIAADLESVGISPDLIAVPTSGGGLIAGVATALRGFFPDCALRAVEPRGFDDFARSAKLGELQSNEPGSATLCDGLISPRPGLFPFEVMQALMPVFETVSDEEVLSAVRALFTAFNIVAEPSGAAAFASVIKDLGSLKGKTIVVVISGGNVDPAVFTRALRGANEDIFHI